ITNGRTIAQLQLYVLGKLAEHFTKNHKIGIWNFLFIFVVALQSVFFYVQPILLILTFYGSCFRKKFRKKIVYRGFEMLRKHKIGIVGFFAIHMPMFNGGKISKECFYFF